MVAARSGDRAIDQRWDLRARARAAGVSLGVSALVVGTVAVLIALELHTLPFFWASAGIGLVALVGLVDVVLGPLLVFLVYDRRKRELRRDLAIVIGIQIAAMGYGIHASVLARPVFMTWVVDRFELVTAAEVDPEELARAPEHWRSLSLSGPVLAAARKPASRAEREQLLFASTQYGIDLRHMLRYYVPYDTVRAEVLAHARPVADLGRYNAADRVAAMLAPFGRSAEELRYLPVQGPREDLVALVDSNDATVLGTVRLQPWK